MRHFPLVEETCFGELCCEPRLVACLGELLACLVEGVLSDFDAFDEAFFAEQGEQLWVVDEQVEFVFGVLGRPCCLFELC